MKILNKLVLSFAAVIVVFLVAALIINAQLGVMSDQNKIIQEQFDISNQANSYMDSSKQMQTGAFLYVQGSKEMGSQYISEGQAGLNSSRTTLQATLTDSTQKAELTELWAMENLSVSDVSLIMSISNGNNANKASLLDNAMQALEAHIEAMNLRASYFVDVANADSAAALSNAQSVSSAAVNTIMLLVALAICISLALAVWVSYRITAPVTALTKVADAVSMGDLSHEINIETKDEIEDLSSSFRRMLNAFKVMKALNEGMDDGAEAKQ